LRDSSLRASSTSSTYSTRTILLLTLATSTRRHPVRRMRKTRARNLLASALKKTLRKTEKMKRKMKIRTTRML